MTIELSAASVALASRGKEKSIASKNCIGSAKMLLFIFTLNSNKAHTEPKKYILSMV
jgi:hypothetical protein